MSFYVTIPSNSSMDVFSNNTLQNFRVQLQSPLHFQGEYEVGLCEIMYPKNWIVNLGQFEILIGLSKITIDLNVTDKSCLRNVMNEINELISTNDLYKNIQQQFKEGNSPKCSLWFDNKTMRFSFTLTHCQLTLSKPFMDIFGFRDEILTEPSSALYKKSDSDKINLIQSLFVYSDIIEHQLVGDSCVQLLRAVSTFDDHDQVDIIYDMPHYIPINKSCINTIGFTITSDTGDIIKFRDTGKVLIKLHFRQI